MAKKKKSPKTSSKNGQKKDVQEQKKDYNVSENEPKKDNKVVLNTKKADSENKGAKKSSKAKADKAEEKSGPKAWKSISQFFKDLRGETKKIVWTSRHDTIKGTGVVLLVVAVVGVFVFGFDWILSTLINLIFSFEKSGDAQQANIMLAGILSNLM